MIRSLLIAAALLIATVSGSRAEGIAFPPLTGRIVDEVGVLSPAVAARLTAELATHEQRSGQQVVVAIVKTLAGHPIEDYGYQLGRTWGIGQKGKNTGAILLVVPSERKVRIEVGYGLEGDLTDAASVTIINRIIVPRFRQGDMEGGIVAGAEQILVTLGDDPKTMSLRPVRMERQPEGHGSIGSILFTFLIFGIFMWIGSRRGRGGGLFLPFLIASSFGGRGGRDDFGGGGGFSGGGGSFGGGGASGSW